MSEEQTELLHGSQALGQASGEARAWVTRVARTATSVGNEEHSLAEATRRAENLSRKLAASAGRRNSAGVFGPSQAGKSYLVSVLAKNPQSRNALTANFAGKQKNFIAEINPPGDRESTGLVTRFTIVPGTTDQSYPVELRMLTETDLVKILGNSFLSDFDPNNRKVKLPDEALIRAAVTAAEAQAGTPAKHLDEITMFDIGEYFRSYFSTGVESFTRAGYWDALTRFGHRLPIAARIKLYALLWGNLEDFTKLFILLHDALEKLQHAPQARASLEALEPRETSIIDVQILLRSLNTAEDAKDLISVLPEIGGKDAAPVKVPRAVLTTLIAEIKVVIAEKPWAFFEHTDLLDFPGARSRSKLIELPPEKDEREEVLRHMMLRGKIAYLFQRYTEERELTCMMLCMPPSVAEVKDLAGMVRGWVDQTHGTTAEQRMRLPCALFLVLTKFDMDFIEKEGDTASSRRDKFTRRLGASFLELYGRDQWAQDWDGQPFRNSVFLRNPGMAQPHIIRYGETRTLDDGSVQRVEAAIADDAIARLEEYKAGFLQSPECQKHFSDREAVWDSAFKLNDGGVAYLVSRLEKVLSARLKSQQLAGRLVEQAKQLDARLRRFYQADDDASRKEKEDALGMLRRRLYQACNDRNFGNFVEMLSRFKIAEGDVRGAFLNVASLKVETNPATETQAPPPDDDPWADPWADQTAVATKPAAVAAKRRHDRCDLFAMQVLNLWTERVRGLSSDGASLAQMGLDAQVVSDLGNEMIIAAHRTSLIEAIGERVRNELVAANVRWDEVADRGAGIATMLVNDFVSFLGYGALAEKDRPGVPEPPKTRMRGVFSAPPLPARDMPPALGERRAASEREYFLDWGVALKQVGIENVNFSGGREIQPEDNRALGMILDRLKPAMAVPVNA
jgi:hypothetical protein